MAWTPKAGVPAAFNSTDAFVALITGSGVWGWLLDWIPFMPSESLQTADFCAKGPPAPVAPLTALDFVGLNARWLQGTILNYLGLGYRLRQTAYDRIFQAYCENVTTAALGPCATVAGVVSNDNYWYSVPIPPGANTVRIPLGGGGGIAEAMLSHTTNATGPTAPYEDTPGGWNTDGAQTVTFDVTPGWEYLNLRPIPGVTANYYVQFCGQRGGTVGHIATDQPAPADVVPRTRKTYGTIADLGYELDNQEWKLDAIRDSVIGLAAALFVSPINGSADPPVDAAAGPLIAPKATGYRIDVSNIPAGSGEAFGTPAKYYKIGRYALGSPNGWLPSVELSHAQMFVAAVPVGVDRIQVTPNPPATATITALYPPK